jgi:acyl-CoA thioesterase II
MPTSTELIRLLSVEPLGDDRFLGHQPSTSILAKTYGGQLFGQALASAAQTVDVDRVAHSVQIACLEAGRHDVPLQYQVERTRDGRSFSARTVVATQEDRVLMHLHASFQVPERGLQHAAPMPDTPAPSELPSLQDVMRDYSSLPDEPWRREWQGIDIRYVPDRMETSLREQQGVQQVWLRVQNRLPDDPALHLHVLAYLSDLGLLNTSLVPHGFVLGAPELPRATLNHTIWFHGEVRADEWLLVDQHSPWAGGARGLSFGRVFSADGRQVASLAQEGLVRPYGALRARLELS